MTGRIWVIFAITIACVLAALFVPAMPQPLDYHHFIDRRTFAGIPNAQDVASNIGFAIAGLAGLVVTLRHTTVFASDIERLPYAIFFLGMVLTTFGSGYYHLAPDNERLFWDRLPMTIAFMSLIASQIVDRFNRRAGIALLFPMLFVGAASVVCWRITERAGSGNVMPYGILQGYSVLILLLIAVLQPSRYTRASDLYFVFAWYVAAKLLEAFDGVIFAAGNIVSGHTIKHLAAAGAGFVICRMLAGRTLLLDEPRHEGQRE